MVLVTGPTNQGKTTTLMAAIRALTTGDRKICTVEDPIEYKLPGIIQTEVNARVGYTFANALRALLRHDPDIIVVGEIRDDDTAQTACEAALTGHLVLASVHVDIAAGAPTRLIEMNVEPYVVASTLRGVLAQRLVRRLCPSCKVPVENTEELVAATAWPATVEPPLVLFDARPGGCPDCVGIGYRGQLAVCEFLTVTDTIRSEILRKSATQQVLDIAVSEGMMTMLEDGLAVVSEGLTSLTELYRVMN
jgi:general secretion pathway protein E